VTVGDPAAAAPSHAIYSARPSTFDLDDPELDQFLANVHGW
jgi:hypothetical protein